MAARVPRLHEELEDREVARTKRSSKQVGVVCVVYLPTSSVLHTCCEPLKKIISSKLQSSAPYQPGSYVRLRLLGASKKSRKGLQDLVFTPCFNNTNNK